MNEFAMKQVISNEQAEEVPDDEGEHDKDGDDPDSEEHDETENEINSQASGTCQIESGEQTRGAANNIIDRLNVKEIGLKNKEEEETNTTDRDSDSTNTEDE